MSAVFGVFFLDGRPVEQSLLDSMAAKLGHRVSDGRGTWKEASAGFGHLMRWTTPESRHERLPLANHRGDLVITSDARIDNRDELAPHLDFGGRPPGEVADSEFILAAYEKWGEQCPEKLLGDFAFAIWDRARESVFCARDQMGVKPFYHYHRPGRIFVFATEVRALFVCPEVPREIDHTKSADYFLSKSVTTEETYFRGVRRLKQAHSLTVSAKSSSEKTYWRLDPEREIRPASEEAGAAEFLERFTRAVECRLRSAYPIASQLSGGLDSSAVTCVARNLLQKRGVGPLLTISNVFNTITQCDERTFINEVLKEGGLDPVFVDAELDGPLTDCRAILERDDEGGFGSNGYMTRMLLRMSRARGARIALDGLDGDSTVWHAEQIVPEMITARDWSGLRGEINGLSRMFRLPPDRILRQEAFPLLRHRSRRLELVSLLADLRQISQVLGVGFWSLVKSCVLHPWIPAPVLRWVAGSKDAVGAPARPGAFQCIDALDEEFRRRINLAARQDYWKSYTEDIKTSVRAAHIENLESGVHARNFERLDRDTAVLGLESRHPFMDVRLVEYCVALPTAMKRKNGWSRYVMRLAMRGILPEMLVNRYGKASMVAAFHHGLTRRNAAEVKELIELVTSVPGWVRPEVMARLAPGGKLKDDLTEDEAWEVGRLLTEAGWLALQRG